MGYYSFAAKKIFTQWNMKAVLPADTTFVQINRIPVELCGCRKDLKFNAILIHSDWGTFNEPKYDLSCKFFDTVSRFRKVDRWYIICPKHVCRFDLFFFVRAKRKYINFSQITVATTAVDSENGVFQTSLDFDKIKALLNLSVHFSKITYHKVYLGKV